MKVEGENLCKVLAVQVFQQEQDPLILYRLRLHLEGIYSSAAAVVWIHR